VRGPGLLLAERKYNGVQGFCLTKTPEQYLLRFYGMCEFEIRPDFGEVRPFHDPSRDVGWLQAFLAANVFGHLLALAGKPGLHASAVSFPEGVVAFVAGSGQGKSTMAALLCAEGGCLMTDDLLALELKPNEVLCHTGSQQIRLKEKAASLASLFPQQTSKTPDDRLSISLSCEPPSTLLGAIVVPQPSKTETRIKTERLSEKEAFLRIAAASYLGAWKTSEGTQSRFRNAGEIVRKVPVFTATIPWGPPFKPEAAVEIRRLLQPLELQNK